jgi:hypothetical protein
MSKKEEVIAAPAESPKFVSGFAILITETGEMFLERSPKVFSLPVDRESTIIEVRRYCSEILMDISAQSAAEYTLMRFAQANQGTTAD